MTQQSSPCARRTGRRLAGTLVTASLIGVLSLGAELATAAPIDDAPHRAARATSDDAPQRAAGQHPHLASSLQDDAGAPTTGEGAPADADGNGTVTVVVEAADPADARRAVEAVGGTIDTEAGGLVQADVQASELADLASSDGVQLVREPRPVVMDELSEGVAETGGQAWQDASLTGTGTTVAIVDGGFSGYAAMLGTELPLTVQTDFARCGGPGASEHGSAVAEIVHDMAPDATLRLICIQTDVDFVSALDTLPAAVDIVNGSIGFSLVGRGDGTGSVSTAVARARDRGVLYVAAAGNYEGSHFHTNAVGDTPGNTITDLVNISPDDGLAFGVPPGGTAFVSVQWDAWPTTTQDFDVYIEDQFGTIVNGSENNQANGSVPQPIEFTGVTNSSGSTRTYFVLVNRFAGTATPRIDFFFDGDVLGIEHTSSSSVADPGSSPAAFTVGAHCVDDGAIEFFSSRGPTIDGRIKPDISAPDATSSSVYGPNDGCVSTGFFGTSAASPHVAGAAAQVLEASPNLDVAELQQVLEDKAQEAGAAGADNVYGNGRLRLGTPGDVTLATPQPFTPRAPIRLFDTRAGQVGAAEVPDRTAPVGPGGKLKVQVAGIAGVPADATAVVLNVTAVSPTAAGYVTVHPGGTVPNASNLNFKAGQTVAVHVTATVGADDKVELFNAVGSTHLIVDLAGWYGPTGAGGPATDLLHTLAAPARAIDTRAGPLGYAEGVGVVNPVGAGQTLSVPVAGAGGVPLDATAVVMNVTAVHPTASTFVVAYPQGSPQPGTSSLNAALNQVVANLVVVPLGTGGRVWFFNSTGSTHLIVDTIGWFEPGAGGAGYVALDPPTRDLDTRTGTGLRKTALGPNGVHKLKVARYDGVPSDALAVMLGVIAVSPTTGGYLTIYPGTQGVPDSSNLNFAAGATTPNAVLTGIGTDGTVAFRNATGSTHVVSDLFGFFIDPANVPDP